MTKKSITNFLVWAVLALLIVGLMGFGVTNFSNTTGELGRVGTKPIKMQTYGTMLNNQLRALEAQTGETISFPQAQQMGLDRQVLSQLVTQRVLDNETARLGLSVGDEKVLQEIVSQQAFQGADGKFSREAYEYMINRVGLSEQEFEDGIREDVTRTLLQGAVLGGVAAPQGYAQAILDYTQDARNVTWATVTADLLDAPVTAPTDADLQAFYDENTGLFTAPESRSLTAAALTPDMIQDQVDISEDALRAMYDERIAEYMTPERRLVERLVYPTADEAQAAADRLTAGDVDFDALVAERGLDLSDVDMGDVAQSELGGAGAAVFAVESGDVAGPVNTTLGPALFRVNAILAAQETPFDVARAELREELAGERARRIIEDRREGIEDLIAGGATLEDLAERTEMRLEQMVWTEDTAEGLAAYEAVRAAAPNLSQGALPDLIELDDGGLVALRLDGITPAQPIPFADVRDRVATAWVNAETAVQVAALAEDFAAQLQDGADFATLGLSAETAAGLTRRAFVADTPADFNNAAFATAIGDAAALSADGVSVVLRVDGQGESALTKEQAQSALAQLNAQLSQGVANDIFAAFATRLQEQTDITVDQAAVNAVNAQFQ